MTIARKARGRSDWFIGSITDENAREMTVSLNFLDPGARYEAVIYRDADTADFEKNPEAYVITKSIVTRNSKLSFRLQRGGGCAVSLKKL